MIDIRETRPVANRLEQNVIAHVQQGSDQEWKTHLLSEHLQKVAERAANSAQAFGSEEWAYLAGLWHDLGKFRPRFQRYIRQVSGYEADAHIKGEAGRAPHSTAGAVLACERFGVPGRVLAYLIASHHAGLYDWHGGLNERLSGDGAREELREALAQSPSPEVLDHGTFTADLTQIPGGSAGFALWVRMLFSALVDADFLDTEEFMNPELADRRGQWPDIATLLERFNRHMEGFTGQAEATPVNKLRAEVLQRCRQAAALPPGLFTLTVPTGGGKTLSGMAFALEHAKRHGQRRVIHVIPYTSIIEQTADVFRGIFGEAVVEHHSNAETKPDKESSYSRLACENWDAPIIVTTNVQFFESLFAARTSRCRKLHNIVNSVVVLDEAQLLPPELLQPILDVLKLLTRHYGVTVVMSTATQPALASKQYFDRGMEGLDDGHEIIEDPDALFRKLERVDVRLPADWNTPITWPGLAEELSAQESVLAIVNTRKHARELHRLMPKGTLHLSALMCGAHRADVIGQIKARLRAKQPTRVISTQLVEAGVDLDFPAVYRALAGLDSIAQAAGRCNREGGLEQDGQPVKGKVVVFVAPEAAPPGLLRRGEDACKTVLHAHSGTPLDPALFKRYFEHFYHACNLDEYGIRHLLDVATQSLAVNFRTAAEQFQLIREEGRISVVIRYRGAAGSNKKIDGLIKTLHKHGPERRLMRELQRYTVNLSSHDAKRLQDQGDLQEITPGMFVQASDWLYHPILGVMTDNMPANPADTVC